MLVGLTCLVVPIFVHPAAASAFTPRTTAPSTSDYHYYSNQNPFYASGYGMPNCTAYAWGRAWEIRGTPLPAGYTGHAYTWWNPTALPKGSTPALGAIAVWGGTSTGSVGHVAVVEAISGGTVTVSESSWGGAVFAMDTVDHINTYGGCGPLLGYIYTISATPSSPNVVSPGDPGFTKGPDSGWYPVIGGGNCGQALFTYVNNTGRSNWGRWTFDLTKMNGSGQYKIEAFIPSRNAGTRNADYHINASSGVQHHSVNQYLTSGWTDLGTYPLSVGSAWIELDDLTGEAWAVDEDHEIAFDSIRITYQGASSTLGVAGPVTLSAGPYCQGDTITGSVTLQNTGAYAGTWGPVVLALRGPSGENRDAVAASSITLAAGESRKVTFSKKLDLIGRWTGFVSGYLGSVWQSPAGATVAFSVVPRPTRIEGPDRYETSIAISKRAFPKGAPAVVIASGADFPDALAAAPLAKAYGGPVLLSPRAGLTANVLKEIKRLAPAKVFIAGSGSSVSSYTEKQLRTLPKVPSVTRFSGKDRFDTAARIADALRAKLGNPSRVVVVNGYKFADAVSVAPLAATKGWPILLSKTDALPGYTAAAVSRSKARSSLVVGSEAVVSRKVTAVLPSPMRKGGTDRYQTCGLVADLAATLGCSNKHIVIATGANFPDALAAASLVQADHGLVLLTAPKSLPKPIADRLRAKKAVVRTIDILGTAAGAVSDQVVKQIKTALQ